MSKVQLSVIQQNDNKTYHLQILIDGSDCGYIYLSQEELLQFADMLRRGSNEDIKFIEGNIHE